MLHDTIIQMIRGSDPIVSKNPFALTGTPEANYDITQSGLFIIIKTDVSAGSICCFF